MSKRALLWSVLLAFLLELCLVGCDDDGDKASPVGANIGGRWSGVCYVEGRGDEVAVSARVSQDGDAVKMSTDKPDPPGQRFTGTIDEDAEMELMDASDGEEWSTLEPASSTHIRIGDYVRQPTAEDRLEGHDVAMRIIDLRR